MNAIARIWNRATGFYFEPVVDGEPLLRAMERMASKNGRAFADAVATFDARMSGWFTGASAMRKLPRRKLASLFETERYVEVIKAAEQRNFLYVGNIRSEDRDIFIFELPVFERVLADAQAEVVRKRALDRMLGEADVLTKQLWISILSAVGSVAAAVAALASVAVAYMTLIAARH